MDPTVVLVLEAVGLGALVLGAFLLRHYVKAYVAAKGGNLATKEDIGAITELVEDAKKQSRADIERLKASLQFSTQDRLAVADRKRRTILTMFEQMLALEDLLSVNLGDFPPDKGQSLFRHQIQIDRKVRRTIRAYHTLLLFFTRSEKLPGLAEAYVSRMLGARTVFGREYGKVKEKILEEILSFESDDMQRYKEAVKACDTTTKAFYQKLEPYRDGMRKSFQAYLSEANRSFAETGVTLYPSET